MKIVCLIEGTVNKSIELDFEGPVEKWEKKIYGSLSGSNLVYTG